MTVDSYDRTLRQFEAARLPLCPVCRIFIGPQTPSEVHDGKPHHPWCARGEDIAQWFARHTPSAPLGKPEP